MLQKGMGIFHTWYLSLFFYTVRILLSKFCHPKVRKSRQISVKKSTHYIDYTHCVCKFTIILSKKFYTRFFFTQAPVTNIISEIFMYEWYSCWLFCLWGNLILLVANTSTRPISSQSFKTIDKKLVHTQYTCWNWKGHLVKSGKKWEAVWELWEHHSGFNNLGFCL